MRSNSFTLAERVRSGAVQVDQDDLEKYGNYICVILKNVPTGIYYGLDVDGKYEYLHRVVMNYPDTSCYVVDHADRDTTNCKKFNLRVCAHRFNSVNCGIRGGKRTSQYKGVSFYKRDKTWEVKVGREFYGRFKDEKEAALKYNSVALRKYGEFAVLNIVN